MPRSETKKKSSRSDSSAGESPQRSKKKPSGHHSVYVVYLRNENWDGTAGWYVGMTGLTPEQRFENHKTGKKAAGVVRRFGVRLVPRLYAHLNPMPYSKALEMEKWLHGSLIKRGYKNVFGGH
jgi:predicted GIY-YIG superfamily endonuclease